MAGGGDPPAQARRLSHGFLHSRQHGFHHPRQCLPQRFPLQAAVCIPFTAATPFNYPMPRLPQLMPVRHLADRSLDSSPPLHPFCTPSVSLPCRRAVERASSIGRRGTPRCLLRRRHPRRLFQHPAPSIGAHARQRLQPLRLRHGLAGVKLCPMLFFRKPFVGAAFPSFRAYRQSGKDERTADLLNQRVGATNEIFFVSKRRRKSHQHERIEDTRCPPFLERFPERGIRIALAAETAQRHQPEAFDGFYGCGSLRSCRVSQQEAGEQDSQE